MLTRLHEKLAAWRDRDEGATLVVVIIVMMVLMTGAIVVAGLVTATAGAVVSSRSTAQSRAAADAGLAAAVSEGQRTSDFCDKTFSSADPNYEVTVSCTPAAAIFTSVGTGEKAGKTTTRAVYAYQETQLTGALVSAHVIGGELGTSSLKIHGDENANIVLDEGDFRCVTTAPIGGDVIIRDGNVTMTNGCTVSGSVYVNGSVTLLAGATVKGNIISLGPYASVDIDASTVEGDVYTTGPVVGGDHVEGTIVLDSSVRTPAVLQPDAFLWAEFPWTATSFASDWSGHSLITWTGTDCMNDTQRAKLSTLTTPTVIDATGCLPPGAGFAGLNFSGKTLTLSDDVTIIAPKTVWGDGAKIRSTGGARVFNIIVPDSDPSDHKPSGCHYDPTTPSLNVLDLNRTEMSDEVSGLAYTPCMLSMDGTSTSAWNGQAYGGIVGAAGSAAMDINYRDVDVPGLTRPGGGAVGSADESDRLLTGLLDRRDVK